jgi:nanoRNase/pAp phosphatase (c-di-AMP/oligoRNAs hydrolase)
MDQEIPAPQSRLDQLLQAVQGAERLLILPHNDPDPDAIASAAALAHLLAETLGVDTHIAYKGIIGRAENKALVRYLGRPLRRLSAADLGHSLPLALVDTQPGAGNNALPPGQPATIVLDHHPYRAESSAAAFADIRPQVGATSTMMTGYLQEAGIELPVPLATALFYGIKTDTLGLIRGADPSDVAAYLYLQARSNVQALFEIERAQVPVDYFQRLDATLRAARVYDHLLVSYIGSMRRPDLAAEMADLLLRLRDIQWVLCLGLYGSRLILAIRTRDRRGGAGHMVQVIVGQEGTAGGHGMMAGGQVPLRGKTGEQMLDQLCRRALQYLQIPADTEGRSLIEAA